MNASYTLLSLSTLSWLLVLLLLLTNIFLIRKNVILQLSLERFTNVQKVQVGEKFELFSPVDTDNKSFGVAFLKSGSKKVILFSSTTCPFCKKQNPLWNEMIKQIDVQRYEVFELFRDSEDREHVRQYLETNSVVQDRANSKPKLIFLGDDYLQMNKLTTTPMTIIVNEDGAVEKVWFGLWNPKTIREINTTFGISIPRES